MVVRRSKYITIIVPRRIILFAGVFFYIVNGEEPVWLTFNKLGISAE